MTTKIDVSELKALGKALHKTAPAVEREFNKGLLAYGVLVAESAKGKAGFSTRIPQTIKARRRARSVRVTAGGSTAPHAAALENKGKQGTFRHPVFRTVFNMDTWVAQPAHPFLGPAAEENFDKGVAIILHEVDQAFIKSGF